MYMHLLLLLMSGVCFGMEQKGVDFTKILPDDVKCVIIDNLLREDEIVKSLKKLIRISHINSCLWNLIRNPTGPYAIPKLAQKMDMYPQGVAFYLHKFGAIPLTQLNKYIEVENKDLLTKALWDQIRQFSYDQLSKEPNWSEYEPKIKDLFHKGADANSNDSDLLKQAIELHCYPLFKLCIKAGADVNAMRRIHFTPVTGNILYKIIYSATLWEKDKIPYLKIAINAGADINKEANSNNSQEYAPLILALGFQQKEIAKVLLHAGADVTFSCYEWCAKTEDWIPTVSALSIAQRHGFDELAELIKAKMEEQKK